MSGEIKHTIFYTQTLINISQVKVAIILSKENL